jgi:hypothetical protein
MKYILTEDQMKRISSVVSEQMGIGFWAEQILWGINPEGAQTGMCKQPKNPKDVFVDYYRIFKTKAKGNDQNIKNLTSNLKKSMEGVNLSSNQTLLNFFKKYDESTIGSVIMNWKSNTGSKETLYNWLAGESMTLWTDLMKSITSNPNLKNKNYSINLCNDKLYA